MAAALPLPTPGPREPAPVTIAILPASRSPIGVESSWVHIMPSARRVRLASGLVLFTYVTRHLANHALGLISRRHGGGTDLLPRLMAESDRVAVALLGMDGPRGAGILGRLSATYTTDAAVGGRAAGARPRHPAAARESHRRHPPRVAGVRGRRRVLARRARAVGAGARARPPPDGDRRAGLDPRDDRPALDREAARVVSARGAVAARRRRAAARAGRARLRERRAPGRRARGRSGGARADALARARAAGA